MLRLLTFTSLYPNARQPRHGIFVEQRLTRLVASGTAASSVVAPVPWFPIRVGPTRRFRTLATVPAEEVRQGLRVCYPRFPVVPGLSGWINPLSMALSALPAVLRLKRGQADFDIIDAQFFYPDGVAGMLLGRWLRKPVVITARGSDVNLFPRYPVARRWILWAARNCQAIITVSAALKEALLALGVAPGRVTVLRNGVDLDLFRPQERSPLRAELGLTSPTLLTVGNLVPEKRHERIVESLTMLPGTHLVVIGSGPQERSLQEQAQRLGVAERVTWIGSRSQAELARYYNAADVTLLASSREGMPNVLLESLACGTPVVATNVGGIREIVTAPHAGTILPDGSPAQFAQACAELLASPPDRSAVRVHAERFGWDEPIRNQLQLLQSLVGTRPT